MVDYESVILHGGAETEPTFAPGPHEATGATRNFLRRLRKPHHRYATNTSVQRTWSSDRCASFMPASSIAASRIARDLVAASRPSGICLRCASPLTPACRCLNTNNFQHLQHASLTWSRDAMATLGHLCYL